MARANKEMIVTSEITASQAESLINDQRLNFNRICADGGGVCSDELGSFIELGEDTGEYYVIRILEKVTSDNK